MLAYASGNAEAFEILYERYHKPLYQFVLHGCSNPAQASELFQDIWMSIIGARQQFSDTGAFKSWMFRIARNALIDFYRKPANRLQDSFDEEINHEQVSSIETPLSPMELADLSSNQEQVHKAVCSLPWRQRDAVILKTIAGFTLAEIAVEQGDTIETVKSRLRYAYTKLRQQLRALS